MSNSSSNRLDARSCERLHCVYGMIVVGKTCVVYGKSCTSRTAGYKRFTSRHPCHYVESHVESLRSRHCAEASTTSRWGPETAAGDDVYHIDAPRAYPGGGETVCQRS